MAALQLISLDTTTPRLRAPASGDTYSAPRAVAIAPESLTGSAATTSLDIAQTWNTTGTPSAIKLNVTDTASNAASLLMDLQVGGSSRFSVDKTGATVVSDGTNALTIDSTNGAVTFLQTAQMTLQTSNALILRHGNTDALGVRAVSGAVDPRLDFLNTSNATQVRLTIDAANTLAQRNGTAAQAFNIYNTYTDASNYERGFVRWSSNILQIGTERAGTGSNRSVQFAVGSANYFFNANEIAVFPAAGGVEFSGRFRFSSPALGIARLTEHNGSNAGALELPEWATAPAAPAANNVRIYAEDNGAGKTRLMALFATGAAQQLAIEP